VSYYLYYICFFFCVTLKNRKVHFFVGFVRAFWNILPFILSPPPLPRRHREVPCIKQLISFLLSASAASSSSAASAASAAPLNKPADRSQLKARVEETLKGAASKKSALLVTERLINLPPQIAPPLLQFAEEVRGRTGRVT
jgi:hypothetical protein